MEEVNEVPIGVVLRGFRSRVIGVEEPTLARAIMGLVEPKRMKGKVFNIATWRTIEHLSIDC